MTFATTTDVPPSAGKLPLARRKLAAGQKALSPLHDFPVRDEVLYQYLEWDPAQELLEIGPGSGYTAFWLSHQVRHMTLLDAAQQTVDNLREELSKKENLDFRCADAGSPDLPELLKRQFDAAYGLDVFEYIPDPRACIENLARCLKPGGQLLLSFPNTTKGDGVTWFTTREEAAVLLRAAGFRRYEIFTIRLRPYAALVYQLLHELPLTLFRKLRAGNARSNPQIYEATWAFQHRGRMSRYKHLLHRYWDLLGWILRRRGEIFIPCRDSETILDRQLVIRAWN